MKAADSRVWWFITSVRRSPRGQKDSCGFEKCVEEKVTPSVMLRVSILVTAQSTEWVCRRGAAGSNPAGDVSSYFECCVCYQEEVSAMGRSFVQRNPTECFMYDCDLETSTTRRPRSIGRVEPWQKKSTAMTTLNPSNWQCLLWLTSTTFKNYLCKTASNPTLVTTQTHPIN